VYVEAVRLFVAGLVTDGRVQFERMTAAEVSAFVLAEANRRQGPSIRSVATALRSLLGFWHVEGLVEGRWGARCRVSARDGWPGFPGRLSETSSVVCLTLATGALRLVGVTGRWCC
jgi:hypothetical protein